MILSTCEVGSDGYAVLSVLDEEVPELLAMLRARIRRLAHMDEAGPDEYAEIHRLSRVCWSIRSAASHFGRVRVEGLSAEDVEAIYVLPFGSGKAETVLQALNAIRGFVRRCSTDPESAASAAKSVSAVMEC